MRLVAPQVKRELVRKLILVAHGFECIPRLRLKGRIGRERDSGDAIGLDAELRDEILARVLGDRNGMARSPQRHLRGEAKEQPQPRAAEFRVAQRDHIIDGQDGRYAGPVRHQVVGAVINVSAERSNA